jgi:hypothetical protein
MPALTLLGFPRNLLVLHAQVCPQCNKVSVTFDPYMFVTVPIPVSQERKQQVTFVPWDPTKPAVLLALSCNKYCAS